MNRVLQLGILVSISCIILSACSLQPPNAEKRNTEIPASERVEKVLHDSEAPEIVETGALLPTERLLSSGTIDIGNPDAPLTLLVFTEHHCNYCKEFNSEHLLRLIADFVQSGKLRVQIAYFPLQKYPQSINAAKAVLCAATQQKGLALNNILFERVYKGPGSAKNYAKELEMDTTLFAACMEDAETVATVTRQKEWAQSLGVEYVPTFFLNGEKFVGLPYYADLRGRIELEIRNLELRFLVP